MILFELPLLRLDLESARLPAPVFFRKWALLRLKNPQRSKKSRYPQHLETSWTIWLQWIEFPDR
jgi:hypothetical protein